MIRWKYEHNLSTHRTMKKEQRELFAKGLVDLANIGAGAMVFGQFVSGQRVDEGVMILARLLPF
jgi:hypothetical protein